MKLGHRLNTIEGFPPGTVAMLAALSIATAEEFLAQSVVDHRGLAEVLDVGTTELEHLVDLAAEAAGAAYVESLDLLRHASDPGYGALPPTTQEFDNWMAGSDDGGTGRDDGQEGCSTPGDGGPREG